MATIDFPTDVYPTSSSISSSYGGLPEPYGNQVLASIIPKLLQQVQGLPGNIDEYTRQGQQAYTTGLQGGLKSVLPGVLNNLASRNMLNSSVASDAIGKAYTNISNQLSPALFSTAQQGSQAKMNLPSVLGNLAQLGQVNTGGTVSQNEDPSIMYRAYMNFLSSI